MTKRTFQGPDSMGADFEMRVTPAEARRVLEEAWGREHPTPQPGWRTPVACARIKSDHGEISAGVALANYSGVLVLQSTQCPVHKWGAISDALASLAQEACDARNKNTVDCVIEMLDHVWVVDEASRSEIESHVREHAPKLSPGETVPGYREQGLAMDYFADSVARKFGLLRHPVAADRQRG